MNERVKPTDPVGEGIEPGTQSVGFAGRFHGEPQGAEYGEGEPWKHIVPFHDAIPRGGRLAMAAGCDAALAEQDYILGRGYDARSRAVAGQKHFPTCWRCLTISTGEAFNNRRPD